MTVTEAERALLSQLNLEGSSPRRGPAGGGMRTVELMPKLEFFQWEKICNANRGEKIARQRRYVGTAPK